MKLKPFYYISICGLILLSACSNSVKKDFKSSSFEPEEIDQTSQASVLTALPEIKPELSNDEIKNLVFETAVLKEIPFYQLAEVYQYFPRLSATNEPLLNIQKYEFSSEKKEMKISGTFRENAFDYSSDLDLLMNALEENLGDFEFSSKTEGNTFEITGIYKLEPAADYDPELDSGEISETKKMMLIVAIPNAKEQGKFLQSIADLSEKYGLSINWIKENKPFENNPEQIASFQITLEQEGFMQNLLSFINELRKFSRKVYFAGAEIERTDIRSGIELGKGIYVVEVYYMSDYE